MTGEEQRQRRNGEMVAPIVDVTDGVEPDGAERKPTNQIGLRGKAHGPNVAERDAVLTQAGEWPLRRVSCTDN